MISPVLYPRETVLLICTQRYYHLTRCNV